jgi:acyl carrier protein
MENRNVVSGIFEKVFGIEKPSPDLHFTELGADSIGVMKLQIEIRKQFGFKIDFRKLYSLGSVNEIGDYISANVN